VASHVREEIPTVRFVVVGQGPLEAEIRAQARTLGLSRTVLFTGFREDAPRVASCFDVFVLTSEYEGLSIAVIEALALGKPVVVSRVGGLPEVVEDGRQGFLVAPIDTEAFAERIVKILRDPELCARMSEAARLRATSFDIGRAVSRMEQVYGELLTT
jgi:glycosyltransferase involved in cell wall biosynthesis